MQFYYIVHNINNDIIVFMFPPSPHLCSLLAQLACDSAACQSAPRSWLFYSSSSVDSFEEELIWVYQVGKRVNSVHVFCPPLGLTRKIPDLPTHPATVDTLSVEAASIYPALLFLYFTMRVVCATEGVL